MGGQQQRGALRRDHQLLPGRVGQVGAELDRLAAETIKRARHHEAAAGYETAIADALERIEAVTELKTAWHPVGA